MKKFLVVVEGRNCILRNDTNKSYGFFASRYAEAKDSQEAADIVIQVVRDELYTKNLLENSTVNPPMILVEEIRNVESFDSSLSTRGFTFYVDDTPGPT